MPFSFNTLQLEKPVCSGRDHLCKEVLNDTFVSHPTWASEESGFIAHRKNVYEEHLHRVEEDRYEIDRNLEANSRVISLLEPIAHKIQVLASQEDREDIKLQDYFEEFELHGLKGSICVGVIKKIYDRERGLEVLDAMQKNPTVTVPIVLKRLKQKDIEWKKIKVSFDFFTS
jgi:paired amphipathic helix protein Sin3a